MPEREVVYAGESAVVWNCIRYHHRNGTLVSTPEQVVLRTLDNGEIHARLTVRDPADLFVPATAVDKLADGQDPVDVVLSVLARAAGLAVGWLGQLWAVRAFRRLVAIASTLAGLYAAGYVAWMWVGDEITAGLLLLGKAIALLAGVMALFAGLGTLLGHNDDRR